MKRFAFDDLADDSLLDGTLSLRKRDRLTTALLVARIGEIDVRRLAERRGYRSTLAWCIAELRLSEDEACRRIRAARYGRRFPQLFEALADGRLRLTAVNLIGPHLSKENVEAFALLIPALKKRKFATSGTGARRMTSDVKEEVWERDGGRCTYVGEGGRGCGSTWQVEFGHVIDVACGGDSMAGNIRCLCRAHNQLEAELRFGAGFMEEKRREAIEARRAGRIEVRSGTRAGAIVKSEDRTRAGAGDPASKPSAPTCAGAEACSPGLQPDREPSTRITAA